MAAVNGRILALAWMMPPLVFPRSLQVSRTLKSLTQYGWHSTVVTIVPDAEPFAMVDQSLADFYTGCYQTILVDPREETVPSPWWLRAWRRYCPPQDIKRDNWIRRTVAVLNKELKTKGYDVLATFAQPWVNHLAGLEIKRRYPRLPWVVHFSDPWVDSPYTSFSTEEQRVQAHTQEQRIIETADAVVFVNQYTADLVMKKYPASWRSKVHLVSHGYDKDLLELVSQSRPQQDMMRVVHTGNLYGQRNPELILRVIADLARDAAVRCRLRVEFIGYVDEQFATLAHDLGLDGVVVFRGKVGYLESLSVANSADLLLLIDAPAEQSVFLPSKVVDYLMLQRPILGITPLAGASADVLRQLGCPVVPPDDAAAIAMALRTAFERWSAGQGAAIVPDSAGGASFDIQRTTRDFARALAHTKNLFQGSSELHAGS